MVDTNLDSQDALASVLQQLRGPSDENRVVGLLLLTKHVSLHSHNDQSVRTAVLKVLDPQFLRRLLVTDAKIGDSATDALALGMLAFFCRDVNTAAAYCATLFLVTHQKDENTVITLT